jgi:hypothetical protein
MSSTQSNDSLRKLNAKLLAEIGELRKKFAEIKIENDELRIRMLRSLNLEGSSLSLRLRKLSLRPGLPSF